MTDLELMENLLGLRAPCASMKTDIVETDKEIMMYMDMPGICKKDIKVVLDKNILTVSAERKALKIEEGKFVVRERHAHTSKRSFRVPVGVKSEDIKAKYDDGVLVLTITKPEEIQPNNIEID